MKSGYDALKKKLGLMAKKIKAKQIIIVEPVALYGENISQHLKKDYKIS